MTRYLKLLGVRIRTSLLVAMQYRTDFFFNGFMALFWTVSAVAPLMVLFSQRESVGGWTWPQALVVVAWFTLLKGVLNGAIQPSMQAVVEQVRKGTLDFILLKPVDAQFLVSTAQFELWRSMDVCSGLVLLGYALSQLGHEPTLGEVGAAVSILLCAVVILYSIWIAVVSLAFRFVKVDNLNYLFLSLYDAARWPSSVFRGAFAFVFTFILPLAVLTTYPALAITGRLQGHEIYLAAGLAMTFLTLSRLSWKRSIAHYTSAGG